MPLRRVARRMHGGEVQEIGLTEQRLAEFWGKGGGALPRLQAAWCASFTIGGQVSACNRCPSLLLFVQSAQDLWLYTCFFNGRPKKNHSNLNNHSTQAVEAIFAGRTPVGGHHDGRPRRHWFLQGGGENDDFAHGGDMSGRRSRLHWWRPFTTALQGVGGQERTKPHGDRTPPVPACFDLCDEEDVGRGRSGALPVLLELQSALPRPGVCTLTTPPVPKLEEDAVIVRGFAVVEVFSQPHSLC